MDEPATHTPGPWACGKIVDGEWRVYERESGKNIAATPANARLIAAAPLLLEALQALTEALDSGIEDLVWPCTCSYEDCPYNLAHEAIAAVAGPAIAAARETP